MPGGGRLAAMEEKLVVQTNSCGPGAAEDEDRSSDPNDKQTVITLYRSMWLSGGVEDAIRHLLLEGIKYLSEAGWCSDNKIVTPRQKEARCIPVSSGKA